MKNLIAIIFIIIFTILFYSCSSPLPVTINGRLDDIKKYKKMAIVEFIIAPHAKPDLPLINAALYKSGLRDIVQPIISLNKQRIDSFEVYFSKKFIEYSKIDLRYGLNLRQSPEYIDLKNFVNNYNVDFDDSDFPFIQIPNGAYNFFNFYKTDSPDVYFNRLNRKDRTLIIKNIVDKICEKLNMDGAIIIITGIGLEQKSKFLAIYWNRLNYIIANFYDRNGNRFLSMEVDSESIDGEENDINSYSIALNKFYINSDFMLKVLFGLEKNESETYKRIKD